jgi:hypothetical protein
MTDQAITEDDIKRWRKAIASSPFVLLDGRQFMIMWKWYDQFGIRNLETGEQYSFTYEEAIKHKLLPLLLCPVDIASIDINS